MGVSISWRAVAKCGGNSGTITPDRIGARYARAVASVENVHTVIWPAAVLICTKYSILLLSNVARVYVKAEAGFFWSLCAAGVIGLTFCARFVICGDRAFSVCSRCW